MLQKNLKGKVILVIGGSSGIGLAVAKEAYEYGAIVTITSRSMAKAQLVASQIGVTVNGAELDVDNSETVVTFLKGFSSIDHIYIAAGSTKLGTLTELDLEESMAAFNTRIKGSLLVVREAISKMAVGGSITFTGGISTDRPIAGAWVSGLATASAEQMARVLLMEYPSVRFNAVSPGYTDTPMWDSIMGENKETILNTIAQAIPVKKIATPEEVAFAVLFLMSNPSVSGEVIHIDGGHRFV